MTDNPDKELTFGHAMHEFCYYRVLSKTYLINRTTVADFFNRFDIFSIMFEALFKSGEFPNSAAFYLGGPSKRRRKRFIRRLNKMIN